MSTLIHGTLQQVDRSRRRIIVGMAELPVAPDIALDGLQAGMAITIVTEERGGVPCVTLLELDRDRAFPRDP